MNTTTTQWLGFRLEENRYALGLDCVAQVVPLVEITPLPQAPAVILGVINVHGRSLRCSMCASASVCRSARRA